MVSGYEKSSDYGGKEPTKRFISIGVGIVYGIPLVLGAYTLYNWAFASPTATTPYNVERVYWHDGDSGRIDGRDFRLANIDAPETGGVGAAVGGAHCELERERGFAAKEYVVELTRDAELTVTQEVGEDRYGRMVIELSANGEDVATSGVAAGFLQSWPHQGRRALTNKPDWCE